MGSDAVDARRHPGTPAAAWTTAAISLANGPPPAAALCTTAGAALGTLVTLRSVKLAQITTTVCSNPMLRVHLLRQWRAVSDAVDARRHPGTPAAAWTTAAISLANGTPPAAALCTTLGAALGGLVTFRSVKLAQITTTVCSN